MVCVREEVANTIDFKVHSSVPPLPYVGTLVERKGWIYKLHTNMFLLIILFNPLTP